MTPAEALNEAVHRIRLVKEQGAEVLDLGDLPLGELPEELGTLTGLRYLSLGRLAISLGAAGLDTQLKYDRPKQTALRLAAVGRLTGLEFLDLTDCEFGESISGLAGLQSLRHLGLNGCWQVRDISALASLTALQHLDLSKTGIRDLEAVGNLVALQNLLVQLTEVSDLTPLTRLPDLRRLDLTGCKSLTDISPLARVPSLEVLSLRLTKVRDVSVLEKLPNLKRNDREELAGDAVLNFATVAVLGLFGVGAVFGAHMAHIGGRTPKHPATRHKETSESLPDRLRYKTARQRPPGAEAGDLVDVTVFAPPSVPRGGTLLVQVFAHTPEQAEATRGLAQEFDPEADRRGFKSLETEIPRHSRLTFHLMMPGLRLDEHMQTMVWLGRPGPVQFRVTVPGSHPCGATVGTLVVSRDSVPVGQVKFKLVVEMERPVGESEPLGNTASLYRKAFISYASHDRAEVLKRVQMLALLKITFFQDLLNLAPGARWERELYRNIDDCDLFLLFWSSFAKRSKWVMKEARYALGRQGNDEAGLPAILPVIIEGPPPAKPPRQLAHLHFNDYLTYLQVPPATSVGTGETS